jgi:hypothetical protein
LAGREALAAEVAGQLAVVERLAEALSARLAGIMLYR